MPPAPAWISRKAVVAVGLAGQQRLELEAGEPVPERRQRRLGLGGAVGVVLLLGELGERQAVLELVLEPVLALDRAGQAGALAHQRLGALGLVPELGLLDLGVQLLKASLGGVPVKDASSAGRDPARSLRPDG